jgi:hypothetical protein
LDDAKFHAGGPENQLQKMTMTTQKAVLLLRSTTPPAARLGLTGKALTGYGLTLRKKESNSGSDLMAVCQIPQPSGKHTQSQLNKSRNKELPPKGWRASGFLIDVAPTMRSFQFLVFVLVASV